MALREVSLGDFLQRSEAWVQPSPDEHYKQITARLWGKGLVLRGDVNGAQIAADRQIKAKAGQFLISRIDARHGAFGIVPTELDGALVSGDFPCFEIDRKLVEPRFFEWLAKTENFIDLCRRSSEGSTNRVRLKEAKFLQLTIHLPPLDEQLRIVARLTKTAGLVEERQQLTEAAEKEAEGLLLKAFARSVEGAPYRPLADVAPLVRRPVEIDPERKYTEIGVKSFYGGVFHRRTLSGSEFSWQDLFRMHEGDLVFSNLMAWEQAIAVASARDSGCVGNHRMLTCEVDRNAATPGFLMAYFRTPEGFSRVIGHSPGSIARNKTLSSKKLPTIEVPVPPLETQRWFDRLEAPVETLRAIRRQTEAELDALMPALLHKIFNGGATELYGRPPEAERLIVRDFRRHARKLPARRFA